MHLYRIVQEAVNNSIRHGKAKNISIRLRRDGQGRLTLTVVDDGTGLSEKTSMNPGLGLRIMQYRARMLGAALTAERHTATRGTIVQCCCPPYDEGSTRD
jgi:signal transduction histidine kinase